MTTPRYLEPYLKWSSKFGSDFGVTLWASEASQIRRFRVLTECVYLPGKRILDAGCSRGDLAVWLREQGISYGRYIGVDGLDDVIAFARTRDIPDSEFHAGDLLDDPDLMKRGDPQVIFVSGTLNTMTLEQATRLLDHAWRAGPDTLVFNFLSDLCAPQAPKQDDFARRLSATKLLTWATERTWSVVLRQDYFKHGHDATIVMQRT